MSKKSDCDKRKVPEEGSFVRQVFDFDKHEHEYGGFGFYFKTSKSRGVKIIHSYMDENGLDCMRAGVDFSCSRTPEELIKQKLWKMAVKEFDLIVKAHHLSYVPNAYKIVPCKVIGYSGEYGSTTDYGEIYLPGIVMKHIPYPDLYKAIPDRDTRHALSEEIERITKIDGLYLGDHSCGCNILGKPDKSVKPWGVSKWWIIDFTPGYVRMVKRRKKSNDKKN